MLFLGALGLSLLFCCRAFQPEVVIVNKEPETYIIGAPAETSGGYFHFHVFWYGSDADGAVEKFVWALTDTSIQDIETDDDEEDENFDPGEDINTLDIGHWTSRTDSIFDFQINQGDNLSVEMTLHMVAVDDRGDFDRSPARLRFFSNALDRPELHFRKSLLNDSDEWVSEPFASEDTIAFGERLDLSWSGTTANILGYDPELLALRDTVAPYGDGLYGFKWRIRGDGCDEARDDCWHPKLPDEATGDSFSYFGTDTSLIFLNNDSGTGFFGRRLDSGTLQLMVNTIDMAGVQLPPSLQLLNIVINYAPSTLLLRGEQNPFDANDPETYPYYEVYNGPEAGRYPFVFEPDPEDPTRLVVRDTIPDFARVVFMALGKDDVRDQSVNPDFGVVFKGSFTGRQRYQGGNFFEFAPAFSDTHRTENFKPANVINPQYENYYGDTLSFVIGPFDFAFEMRAEDEHGRANLDPDVIEFVANHPPCVQCVELLDDLNDTSAYQWDDSCYLASCLDQQTSMYAYNVTQSDPDNRSYMTPAGFGNIFYKLQTGDTWLEEPIDMTGVEMVPATMFTYRIFLHGREHPREHPTPRSNGPDNEARIMAWKYQVDYDSDPDNVIKDGGGIDDITSLTTTFAWGAANPLENDIYVDSEGVWILRIKVAIPTFVMTLGPSGYYNLFLANRYSNDTDKMDRAWELTTRQFGNGTIRARASDQSTCIDGRPTKGKYHFFRGVRTPLHHGSSCNAGVYEGVEGSLPLDVFAQFSEVVTKDFYFVAETSQGDFDGGPPPGP